jgi:hypothetical protein
MSQNALPIIQSLVDKHSNNDFEYFDIDKDDIDRDKKIFLNKLRKLTGESENIENMARELNLNIEVTSFFNLKGIRWKNSYDFVKTS